MTILAITSHQSAIGLLISSECEHHGASLSKWQLFVLS